MERTEGLKEAFSELKGSLSDWAFGEYRHYAQQPCIEAYGNAVKKEVRYGKVPYFVILCHINHYGDLWVNCERQLGHLIEPGTVLPVTFKVSKVDKTKLKGEIDFTRLSLVCN